MGSSWPLRWPKEGDIGEWLLTDWDLCIGAPMVLGSKIEDCGLEDKKESTNSAKTTEMVSRGRPTGKLARVVKVKCEGHTAMSQL